MAVYSYKAFNSLGSIHAGNIEAASKEDALNVLSTKQLTPVSINKKSEQNNATKKNRLKVKGSSVSLLTRQLLSFIKAGIPLTESLELMIEQSSDANMRIVLKELYDQVRTGKSFSDSLGEYPQIFSELYVNSIRVAEIGGNFEQVLQHLMTQIENDTKVKKDIKKALGYPAFLTSAIILAFIVFTTFIFPKFLPFFQKSTSELPFPTKIVMFMADLISSHGIIIGLIFICTGFLLYKYSRTDKGKYRIHFYLLKMPLVGSLIKKLSSQRFCKTISILIGQGIPLIQAMNIAVKSETNYVLRKKIMFVKNKVENGESIASALKSINIFPRVMIHMISVGEVTGALEQMMDKVSEFYRLEITTTIDTITSLIEPLITIVLAVVVLFLALSIFLPMWNMMGIAH